jgi:acetolactate synthase I/II/III large subunit
MRTGGKLLADALIGHGADMAFCVPGESYLAVLDGLYDVRERLKLIVCRQEGGAAFMAEAYGKLTGRPGICFVTRGPGATNGSIGVHTAYQDSTPMIFFIGQVGNDMVEREAFQEIDYRRMFGQFTKWAAQIDRADRIPEMVSHAFHLATSGRPGPVVLALPEDMLLERSAVADAPRYKQVYTYPGLAQLDQLRSMFAEATKPFVLLGGSGWTSDACTALQRFAEAAQVPIGCAFRRQDLFDNTHPNYAGDVGIGINPKLAARIKEADLILAIGTRLDEMTTSAYSLFEVPRPKQRFVHVHPGAAELGKVYQADLLINSSILPFTGFLSAMGSLDGQRWARWTQDAHADYLASIEPGPCPGAVDPGRIMVWLREHLPASAILTNGAGNFSTWAHRFYQYRPWRTQLAPINGAMGYGVPAAVAAKLVHPHRTVVCIAGDGDFMMTGQELATAMQYKADVIFIVFNNGMYGTIRMHQEREFPARVHGTDLANPDFAALARAYGAHGETVEETSQFAPAFERAVASGRAAVIELRIDPQALTTRATLDQIRAQAMAKRAS